MALQNWRSIYQSYVARFGAGMGCPQGPEYLKGSVVKKLKLVLCFAFVICALVSTTLHAQPWPSKPIKLIVPFPAGGPTDLVGREAANILRNALGQAVVVENRPGGNGTVGLEVLAKSPPDGYTIGLTAITLSIAPHLGNAPFDPFKDCSRATRDWR